MPHKLTTAGQAANNHTDTTMTKTESQLREEVSQAWQIADYNKRAAEIYAAERDHARACYERTIRILTGIHILLYPPRVSDNDGKIWEFRSPDVHKQMQELSDRIRALPDEIESIDQAMKRAP